MVSEIYRNTLRNLKSTCCNAHVFVTCFANKGLKVGLRCEKCGFISGESPVCGSIHDSIEKCIDGYAYRVKYNPIATEDELISFIGEADEVDDERE